MVAAETRRIKWHSVAGFIALHVLMASAFFVPFKWSYVALAAATYFARMLFVTVGYHRYFSHRSFQTSRPFAFALAFLAELSAQKGVLWWASHHRHHHKESDQEDDVHSPTRRGFWWSHVGWIVSGQHDAVRWDKVKDFSRFAELRFISRFWMLPPALGIAAFYVVGGLPAVVWGCLISTVLLFHGTFTINSLSHVFGRRRYLTTDTSRNNWLLALITCGEGWHNNHHYHQNTANQGWFWWELDASFYFLRALEAVGLVWKLKTPSQATQLAHLQYTPAQREQLALQSGYGRRLLPLVSTPVLTAQ